MRKIILALLIVICGIAIIASFFMPWARAVTTATKVATGIKEKVQGSFGETPLAGRLIANLDKATEALNEFGDVKFRTVVSGYELPVFANRQESKTALSLIQVFSPGAEGIGKKILLVYLMPLLALACAALAVLGLKNDVFIIIIALISGAIAVPGLHKILTADISNNIVQITIERGLWQTLYGYLIIFILSAIWIITGLVFGKSRT